MRRLGTSALFAALSLPLAYALHIPPATASVHGHLKPRSPEPDPTCGKASAQSIQSQGINSTGAPVADPDVEQPVARTSCYPAIGFRRPDQNDLPQDTSDWWCPVEDEYAFVGFSYEVTACQSKSQLMKDFEDIRDTFDSRYVRLYGACDHKGFYYVQHLCWACNGVLSARNSDDVIDAAWQNTLGVHALVWFEFKNGDSWKKRRDSLFGTLHSNPLAPFVTRVV